MPDVAVRKWRILKIVYVVTFLKVDGEGVVILDILFGGVLFIIDGKWYRIGWSTKLYGFSLFEFGPPAVYPMDGQISILLAGSDGRKMKIQRKSEKTGS